MLIVQISDLHIRREANPLGGQFDTNARLRTAIAYINALSPQPGLVIATGDLVDDGSAEEYGILREIVSELRAPLTLLRGNHDDVGKLRAAFPDHEYLSTEGRHIQYAVVHGGVRIVALDSLREGTHHGGYCRERACWLDATLAEEPLLPTLIAMHHPPFNTGMPSLDRCGFECVELLEQIIVRHRQVRGLICGHIHRTMVTNWAGVVAMSIGSTSHQLDLDFVGADFRLGGDPPVCRILKVDHDGRLWSHVAVIGSASS